MRTRTALLGSALAGVALVGLTACGTQGAPESGADAGAKPVTETVVDDQPREIIRNADISLGVDDVHTAAVQVNAIAQSAGGRTSQQSEYTEGESVSANLTLRVPAENLDAVMEQLSTLGDVHSVNITTEDVTTQAVDLDARITALQTSVDRLEQLLAEAKSTQDLVEIERELSARQAELDSLTAQRAALSEAVALSTVTVWLSPASTVAEFTPPGFLTGLESGWNAVRTLAGVAITAFGFALPFLGVLLVVAVPVAIVVFVLRRRRRR